MKFDLDTIYVVGFLLLMLYLYLFKTDWIIEKNEKIRGEAAKNLNAAGKVAAPVAKAGFSLFRLFFKR